MAESILNRKVVLAVDDEPDYSGGSGRRNLGIRPQTAKIEKATTYQDAAIR